MLFVIQEPPRLLSWMCLYGKAISIFALYGGFIPRELESPSLIVSLAKIAICDGEFQLLQEHVDGDREIPKTIIMLAGSCP